MMTMRKLLALLVLCLPLTAWPMSPTLASAQLTTLKTTCNADATCAAMLASADDGGVAAWFNTPDPLNCIGWRHDITILEATRAMVWTEIDALTIGKARIWEWMRTLGTLDAREAAIRQGISDAFSGATATRTALTAAAKRTLMRGERALMQAGGLCTTASPSITTATGAMTVQEASLVRVN